ncbi:MAG: ADP-dependent glucokinase/phosphofructokinase [Candidatus Bathyarchaeia archaeon]
MSIPKGRFATGLYTNWDSFVKVDEKTVSWVKSIGKVQPRELILTSIEEVAHTLEEAFTRGGGEHLISKELYDELNSMFSGRSKSLGGNGFHMGRALYSLGLLPLVSYPCRPPNLMAASPSFRVVDNGRLKFPKEAVRETDCEYEHIVFEFTRDLKLGIDAEGRQIFSWDMMSSSGLFDVDFLDYASTSKNIDVLILGYAHLLLPQHKRRTDELIDRLAHSQRPKVHLELGQGSEESVRYAMEKFSNSGCVDSWGMNEDECVTYLGAESYETSDLIEAVANGVKKYGLSRICVHSPEYVFSISRYTLERETEALQAGCLAAAALTFGGSSIRLNLAKAKSLPTSKVVRLAKGKGEGYNLCLIPTYVNPKPKVLTGLGDTFAGVQAAIALR